MTPQGLLNLLSMLYLSGVICLTISINENDHLRPIVGETLRRWGKFLGVALVLMLIVQAFSC